MQLLDQLVNVDLDHKVQTEILVIIIIEFVQREYVE